MWYYYTLLTIHVALCIGLIGLVLLQQGKGADMGAAFGGGSNTIFGAGGATDFITRFTTGLAVAFMVTSILLVRAYTSGAALERSARPVDPLAGSVMSSEPMPDAVVESEVEAPMPIEAGSDAEGSATAEASSEIEEAGAASGDVVSEDASALPAEPVDESEASGND